MSDAFTPSADVTAPGRVGRYRIVRKLGQGGMGRVFLAEDVVQRQLVAVKLPLLPDDDQEGRRRFLREAQLASALSHPSICPVLEVGESEGQPFLVMPYIEGQTLARRLVEQPLAPAEAVAIVRQLALAIREAHAQGILHRDLKPSNIMIDPQGRPILLDFGLASRIEPERTRITQSGQFLGTAVYVAPERLAGATIGPASDVYSLGVILYELLAGVPPHRGPVYAIVWQALYAPPPPPPSAINRHLDPRLDNICLRAIARDPAARSPSMDALACELGQYLAEASAEPRPAVPVRPPSCIGPYELFEKIMETGEATLYRGRHRMAGHLAAIKVFNTPPTHVPALVERFGRELAASRHLAHPNLVQVLDFGVDAGAPYLVLELVEGQSLATRLQTLGRVPFPEAIRLIAQAGEGLHWAHRHGLVHRDIKPEKILVTRDGQVKVAGLAFSAEPESDLTWTRLYFSLPTPHFMAPELFRNPLLADARCDVYALAATLYAVVTGELPFPEASPDAWLLGHNRAVVPPRTFAPEMPEKAEPVLLRALSADPAARPASCRQLLDELTGPATRELLSLGEIDPHQGLWYVLYRDERGEHMIKGTAEAIRGALRDGWLRDPAARAARNKQGPFVPLSELAEFRDLIL